MTTNPELEVNQETSEAMATETEELTGASLGYKEQIEAVIATLAENDSAMFQKNENGHLWRFQYGSVEVFVQLTGEKDEDLLTVWSAIMPFPKQKENELMRQLLEINGSGTFETKFAIINDQVVLLTQRIVDGLSPSEISRAITLVASLADEYDDKLKSQYG